MPSPHHHLSFSSYNVLKPRDPSLNGKITDRDFNCAVSPPNALIGSRYTSDLTKGTEGPYFEIANASAMVEHGLYPYFTLESFYIKPMDAPPAVIALNVRGYSPTRNDAYNWRVLFPAGFHEPFLVKMQEYSGEEWNQIYRVEVVADYGEDALDWEFCLDDLKVQFFRYHRKSSGHSEIAQAILKEHL